MTDPTQSALNAEGQHTPLKPGDRVRVTHHHRFTKYVGREGVIVRAAPHAFDWTVDFGDITFPLFATELERLPSPAPPDDAAGEKAETEALALAKQSASPVAPADEGLRDTIADVLGPMLWGNGSSRVMADRLMPIITRREPVAIPEELRAALARMPEGELSYWPDHYEIWCSGDGSLIRTILIAKTSVGNGAEHACGVAMAASFNFVRTLLQSTPAAPSPSETGARDVLGDFPWDDCKVAFGIDDPEAFEAWMEATDDGQSILPGGWTLCETDGSGARYVAVFRVEGPLRIGDGDKVAATLAALDRAKGEA